jgi:hypothetical protein
MYADGSEWDWWRIDVGNDNIDTGYVPISAYEMKAKMKSRQSLQQAANVTAAVDGTASFDDLDDPKVGTCAQINAAAITWAENIINPDTKARYDKYGVKYTVDVSAGDKKVCVAGPCWICRASSTTATQRRTRRSKS